MIGILCSCDTGTSPHTTSKSSLVLVSSASLSLSSSSIEITLPVCISYPEQCGTFIDNRDAHLYTWVKISNKVWMSENLQYSKGIHSLCYDHILDNCNIYGRLYRWDIAMNIDSNYLTHSLSQTDSNHQGICPTDWHIPSSSEWDSLISFAAKFNSNTYYTTVLKSVDHWPTDSTGFDLINFTALPSGLGYNESNFYGLGRYSSWISSTEEAANGFSSFSMKANPSNNYGSFYSPAIKSYWYSLRCVKN